MGLSTGIEAPDFSIATTAGEFRLSRDFKNSPCIIYFYPKDFTNVCTKEACSFRDEFAIFKELDVDILGISRDDVATHQKFKEQYQLPFELGADVAGTVAKQYKANIPFIGMTKRITYLLNAQHRIEKVYSGLFEAEKHVEEMISKIKAMKS